jgi:hypothetical protein
MSAVFGEFLDLVERDMKSVSLVSAIDDGVRVTTHCMYPSNGLVRVTLRGGRKTIIASDEGEAVGEALSAGVVLKNPDRLLRPLVRPQGLEVSHGIIHTPQMPISAASLAVLLVANAAKEVAQWLYDHQKIKRDRDFRTLLGDFLRRTFDDRVTPAKIVGASNKAHKFANVVSFPNGHRLIIDPVANDPQSINARVVANLDVRGINDPRIDQRIVYDDDETWSPSDLNLLQVGATVVPFSRAPEVISRVAARFSAWQ